MAKKPTYSVRFVAGQPVERIEPSLPLGQIEEMLPIGMPLYTEGTLKIAVWNIYKQQRVNWRSMLETLATDTQLLLLQEAQTTPELVRFAGKNHLIADQVPALAFQHQLASRLQPVFRGWRTSDHDVLSGLSAKREAAGPASSIPAA